MFRDLNPRLRAGQQPKASDRADVKALDEAFAQSKTTAPITVYRGVGGDIVSRLTPGATFRDGAYQSTSSDRKAAENFVRGTGNIMEQRRTSALMEITVPEGARAMSVRDVSQFSKSEQEVLLDRGGEYRVTGVRQGTRTRPTVIQVELVQQGVSPIGKADDAPLKSPGDRFVETGEGLQIEGPTDKSYATQPRDAFGRWTAGGGAWGGGGALGGAVSAAALQAAQARRDAKPTVVAPAAPQLGGRPPQGMVLDPTVPSAVANNANPEDVAVFVEGHNTGDGLNGIPFAPAAPPADWTQVPGQNYTFDEPPPPQTSKRMGAGVVMEEPDGRVWVLEPTNHFGGYQHSLPKGGIEDGLNLQQTALKELWEESGLTGEITGYLGDFERTTSTARYYTARRTGGSPADHGWETQSVKLVPPEQLGDFLNHPSDVPIREAFLSRQIAKALAWAKIARITKSWKNQTRAPAGTPIGGQWVTMGGGAYALALLETGSDFVSVQVTAKNMQNSAVVSANTARRPQPR